MHLFTNVIMSLRRVWVNGCWVWLQYMHSIPSVVGDKAKADQLMFGCVQVLLDVLEIGRAHV